MPLQAQEDAELSMVLVMGVTGSGKSFLINKLVGKDVVRESANMDSCMSIDLPSICRTILYTLLTYRQVLRNAKAS